MASKTNKHVTVGLIALGCPKNKVDSERMLAEIIQAGFLITAEPDNADVVVINTCGFIEPAKAEAIDAIEHAVAHKRIGAVKKVVVAGCLSQRLGQELLSQVNGIDAVVGLGQRDEIGRIIHKTLLAEEPAVYLDSAPQSVNDDRARLLIGPPHWAYLRIAEGCNHRCSFCTIPAIKGPFRSKPLEMVVAEAAELVSAGVVELNIIAQDTTNYGRDLKIKHGLVTLIAELQKIPDLAWIRLLYLYPSEISPELIKAFAVSAKVVHYLDIPIQHASNRILKAMHRPDTKEKLYRLIENLRSAVPDVVLRTTLIVGFPGETDDEFAELLKFVKWARFDALGCFKFYPESGTHAAKLPAQVPDRLKNQRVDQLMLTQQAIAFDGNKGRIGTELDCLIDSVDKNGVAQARFYGQAPEVDSITIIKNCLLQPGRFIKVRVIGTKNYDLLAEQVLY
jgi:ribosomal protein S12 methylthiotransferase